MPDISVIIPAILKSSRQWTWLQDAIVSALRQSRTDYDFEIVVCIDAIDRGLGETKYEITKSSDRIKWVYHRDQRGAGAARNTAAKAATGRYLLPLDADDALPRDALSLLYAQANDNQFVYGNVQYTGDKSGVVELSQFDVQELARLTGSVPVTALHTKALWQAVGGWDESLAALEDVDYWLKCVKHGATGHRIDQVTLLYRRHDHSRQAIAERDRNEYVKIQQELLARHKSVYNKKGDYSMPCASCPQGDVGPMDLPDGIKIPVEVRYNGTMGGSFTIRGVATGIHYNVQGRGSVLMVDERDWQHLATLYTPFGHLEYTRTGGAMEIPPETPITPSVTTAPPVGSTEDITLLNAEDAIALINETTDIPDLFVMAAMERDRPDHRDPRKTVIAAIEKRLQTISESSAT